MRKPSLAGALIAGILVLTACGGEQPTVGTSAGADGRPAHVHGLAVVDGQVLAAAHDGLWQVDGGRAERIGAVRDDLMGFVVAGEGRFLASGHPGHSDRDRPPHLGLIESVDGGRSWTTLSLPGQADFHALAVSGNTVAGYDAGRLLLSRDGGMNWGAIAVPSEVISLAMRPGDERRLLAGTTAGVQLRRGDRWTTLLPGVPALVMWPTDRRMIAVALDGEISTTKNAGSAWRRAGRTPGLPVAAFADARQLIVALEDGSIARSTDDGATWTPILPKL